MFAQMFGELGMTEQAQNALRLAEVHIRRGKILAKRLVVTGV